MASITMKLVVTAILALLCTTASAARTGASLAGDRPGKVSLSSFKAESTVSLVPGSIPGCTPKLLARDLVIFCRESRNAPMQFEAFCGAVISTVARPSCFCLVKEEPAFGMSALLNMTKMGNMLARCGAAPYLMKTLDNPCDGSFTADQTSEYHMPDTRSCKAYRVSTYVGWATVAFLIGAVTYLIVWPPAPATTKVVYMPQIELVNVITGKDKTDEEPAGAGVEITDDATDDEGKGKTYEEEECDERSAITDHGAGEDALIPGNGKRKSQPNPKYIGGPWDNGAPGRRPKKYRCR